MSNSQTQAVPWLSDDEQRAWRAYRRLVTVVESGVAHDLLRDSGLSMTDYDVLSTLSEAPDRRRRIKQLADHMRWTASRLSHHVRRMEGRGLVERETCSTDGRGTIVHLTDLGFEHLEAAAPDHVRSVRTHLFDHLDESLAHALFELASAVVEPALEHPPDA